MRPLQRYDCVWGIQIGKVEGELKAEGVGVMTDADDDDTASTAELTALDLDEEGSDSSYEEDGAQENRPCKGPATILYGGDGTSTRAMSGEEECAVKMGATGPASRREGPEEIPSTEVVRNADVMSVCPCQ